VKGSRSHLTMTHVIMKEQSGAAEQVKLEEWSQQHI